MHGVDIGRRLMKPDVDLIKRRGFSFVCRYYDNSEGANPKTLTPTEVSIILGAGLGIVPVFEVNGNGPWTPQAGETDGNAALSEAASRCGQPLGTPIYFSVDTDANPEDLLPYFNGVFIGLQEQYVIGVYGSYRVCKYARENWPAVGAFWQTYAWSGGAVYAPADIYQHANGVTLTDGLVVDVDFAPSGVPWRIA